MLTQQGQLFDRLLPHTHGVYVNAFSDPDPNVPFFPKVLQEAGYETAFLGKWHMKRGSDPREGFDYWLSFEGQGEYIDPPLNENGREFVEKGYMTDILTDYAIRWMQKPREKPFVLFLWHKAVHGPFTPAPRDSTAFADALIPEYENWYDDMADKPEWYRRMTKYGSHFRYWQESIGKPVPERLEPKPWNPQESRRMNYLRAMLAVDKSTGDIRDCLKDLNILDNTIIVYGSDNGFFIGAHQRGDKRLMYEESIRIPLIIRHPKMIEPGSSNNELVLNIDVAPTLIELAGAPIPAEMEGASMLPLLKNEAVDWRQSFLYEYFQDPYAPGYVTLVGVRNHRYKYIESPDLPEDIDELYDLEKDPYEMNNLINSPEHQSVKADMEKELQRLKTETGFHDPKVFETFLRNRQQQ
jgi:N-acetylglucosamine-6-sulfatase